MMNIRNFVIVILTVCSLGFGQVATIPDVVTKVATSACNWLKLETSARAIGLGGAYVAAGEGVSGIPYNPASVAFLKGQETYISRSNYIAGITHNVIAYGAKIGGGNYIGFHLFYLDSGPMEVTNEWYPDGTGEDFKVISMSFRTTYARRLTDRLKVGMTLNYIRDEIYTVGMQTVAVDIGSNFDTGIFGFILGMSVSNFGPEVRYGGEGLNVVVPEEYDVDSTLARVTGSFSLPMSFRLGIKNDIMGPGSGFIKSQFHRLSLSVDGVNPIDYTVYGGFGCEYSWRELGFLRVGMHLGHDTAELSAGGGIRIVARGVEVSVDYAYVNYGILDVTHQFGIGLGF